MTEQARTASGTQQTRPGFLHTLPGLLTAVGSIIGAIVALITALIQLGTFRDGHAQAGVADAATALTVSSAVVQVDPAVATGRCPATIVLSADLQLSGAAGVVQYRWNWDGQEDSEVRDLQVQAGETSRTITAEAQLGGGLGPRNRHVADAVAIEIVSPVSMASPKAAVEVTCQ